MKTVSLIQCVAPEEKIIDPGAPFTVEHTAGIWMIRRGEEVGQVGLVTTSMGKTIGQRYPIGTNPRLKDIETQLIMANAGQFTPKGKMYFIAPGWIRGATYRARRYKSKAGAVSGALRLWIRVRKRIKSWFRKFDQYDLGHPCIYVGRDVTYHWVPPENVAFLVDDNGVTEIVLPRKNFKSHREFLEANGVKFAPRPTPKTTTRGRGSKKSKPLKR